MANSIVLCGSNSIVFHVKPCNRSRNLSFLPGLNMGISTHKTNPIDFSGYLSISQGVQKNDQIKRNFVVHSSVQPGVPLPSGSSSDSWKGFLVGIVFTVVLPFLTNKWGPLLKLKNQVDTVVETAEHIVDAVEIVAEKVEKVAEDILDDLPAGNLKNAVSFIENLAESTADDAELVGDVIDKVQEAEEKVESFVESASDEEKQSPKEASVNDEAKDPVNEVKVEQK